MILTIICHHGTFVPNAHPSKQFEINSIQVFFLGVNFGEQKLVKVSLTATEHSHTFSHQTLP